MLSAMLRHLSTCSICFIAKVPGELSIPLIMSKSFYVCYSPTRFYWIITFIIMMFKIFIFNSRIYHYIDPRRYLAVIIENDQFYNLSFSLAIYHVELLFNVFFYQPTNKII